MSLAGGTQDEIPNMIHCVLTTEWLGATMVGKDGTASMARISTHILPTGDGSYEHVNRIRWDDARAVIASQHPRAGFVLCSDCNRRFFWGFATILRNNKYCPDCIETQPVTE